MRNCLPSVVMSYIRRPPPSMNPLIGSGVALTSTPKGVADIAADVGYESEAAFNRAFRRAFEVPPARYRRQSRIPASSARSPR